MSNMNGSLDGIIEDLKRLHWTAVQRTEEAKAAYESAKAEADRIHKMLKMAGAVEEEPVKPQRKEKRESSPRVISDGTRLKLLTAISRFESRNQPVLPDVPGSFTVNELFALDPGLHHTSLRNGIEVLRQEGKVRAVGPDASSNAPRKPMVYAAVRPYVPPATGDA